LKIDGPRVRSAARRLIVLACVAFTPALASAQTITVTESNDTDGIINAAECNNAPVDKLAFEWTVTSASSAYDLYVSDVAGCPIPSSSANSDAHTQAFATNIGQTSWNGGDTAAKLLDLVSIACTSSHSALFVCAFPTGTNTTAVATASVQLDLASAPAPVALSASAGDGSLNVSWELGSGSADAGTTGSANSFRVYYAPTADPTNEHHVTCTGSSTTSGRATGLTNGVEYVVTVAALTLGGNESARSNQLTGTPVYVQNFWRLYESAGGQEQGGCATGAGGLAVLAAIAPLALRRRRRRP
jgi:Synergist-CTERM protein sorting domain-containing protein